MNQPLVSVIIPTYNEHSQIKNCLSSLIDQIYPHWEIIVVDDGSTDDTVAAINQFIQDISRVSLYRQKHSGPGAARNLGAGKAKGKILVFVDADMTFDKHFIDRLILPIRQGKTIGTFTGEELVANNHNPWARSWSLLRGWEEGRMHPKDSPNQQPVYRAILKDKFLKVNGFDTHRGYDDDWSLSEKLGVLAIAAPGAIIYHHNPDSLSEIYTQSRWMAKRKYKLGILGKLLALIKVSLPFSSINTLILYTQHPFLPLIPAKLTSDLGQFIGLASLIVTGSTAG